MKTTRLALIVVLAAACSPPPEPEALTDAATVDASAESPDARPDAQPDAALGSPNLRLDGDPVFGATSLGAPVSQTFTVSNHGTGSSVALAIDVDAGAFALGADNCSTHALAVDGKCTFAIAFTPTAAGDATAAVHVTAGAAPAIDLTLSGHGNAPASLSLDPATATDFGSIRAGQATTATTLTVRNDGEEPTANLVIALSDSIDFALVDNKSCAGHPVAAHSTCDVGVSFQPAAAGPASARVTVTAAALSAKHDLSGTGLAPGAIDIVEQSHDFANVRIDAGAVTHAFDVTNSGQVAIAAPTVSITGTGAAAYTETNDCAGSLAASQTCTVTVSFDPGAIGPAAASLKVDSTDGGSDGAGLSGTGTVHVVVTRTGLGTVMSSQQGISCGATCAADFSSTPLTLDATPDATSDFGAWTSCDHPSGTSCTLDLTSGKNIGVSFTTKQRTLTVYLQGTGAGTITVNQQQLACPSGTCTATYPTGTVLAISASPDARSDFTSLTGATCTTSPCTLTINADVGLDATFTRKQYTVTTQAQPVAGGAVTGGGTFDAGSSVQLTAMPAPGYVFTTWQGCTSATTICTIADLEANTQVTANFKLQQFTVSTQAHPAPGGSITGGGTFDIHSDVNLTATPATGYTFDSWMGCTSATATCKLTDLQADTTVIANFTAQFTISATILPSTGGSVSGTGTFAAGTDHALVATANAGYVFSSWTSCPSPNGTTCNVNDLSGNVAVTASFAQQYTISATASPAAGGSISGAGTFAAGTDHALVATANAGYVFSSWTSCPAASGSTCNVNNLAGNVAVTASFTAQYTISATASPAAGGSISGTGTFAAGTDHALVATASPGYVFSSWTSCPAASGSTCNVNNLAGNVAVTASFTGQFTISATASPAAGGSISGTGTFAAGTDHALVATASAGYVFSSWTSCPSASGSTCNVNNLAGNVAVTANFTAQYTISATASPAAGGFDQRHRHLRRRHRSRARRDGQRRLRVLVVDLVPLGQRLDLQRQQPRRQRRRHRHLHRAVHNLRDRLARRRRIDHAAPAPSTPAPITRSSRRPAPATSSRRGPPAPRPAARPATSTTSPATSRSPPASSRSTRSPRPPRPPLVDRSRHRHLRRRHQPRARRNGQRRLRLLVVDLLPVGQRHHLQRQQPVRNVAVTANFTAQYTISATASPAAGGSISGTGTFAAGTNHALLATAATGYVFSSWTSCPSASGSTCNVNNLSANVAVTANFTAQYTITATASPAAGRIDQRHRHLRRRHQPRAPRHRRHRLRVLVMDVVPVGQRLDLQRQQPLRQRRRHRQLHGAVHDQRDRLARRRSIDQRHRHLRRRHQPRAPRHRRHRLRLLIVDVLPLGQRLDLQRQQPRRQRRRHRQLHGAVHDQRDRLAAAGGSISGTGTFAAGTNHALLATAATGYVFSSWTSCPSASGSDLQRQQPRPATSPSPRPSPRSTQSARPPRPPPADRSAAPAPSPPAPTTRSSPPPTAATSSRRGRPARRPAAPPATSTTSPATSPSPPTSRSSTPSRPRSIRRAQARSPAPARTTPAAPSCSPRTRPRRISSRRGARAARRRAATRARSPASAATSRSPRTTSRRSASRSASPATAPARRAAASRAAPAPRAARPAYRPARPSSRRPARPAARPSITGRARAPPARPARSC